MTNDVLTDAYAEGRSDQFADDRAEISKLRAQIDALQTQLAFQRRDYADLQARYSAQYQADAIASANSGTDAINVRF